MKFQDSYPTPNYPQRGKPVAPTTGVEPSDKNYVVAVCLCAIFGILGIHFFYIGRHLHGMIDLGMAVLAITLFALGKPAMALLVFTGDWLHTMIMTYRLLTGLSSDGQGKRICYPGQVLR